MIRRRFTAATAVVVVLLLVTAAVVLVNAVDLLTRISHSLLIVVRCTAPYTPTAGIRVF